MADHHHLEEGDTAVVITDGEDGDDKVAMGGGLRSPTSSPWRSLQSLPFTRPAVVYTPVSDREEDDEEEEHGGGKDNDDKVVMMRKPTTTPKGGINGGGEISRSGPSPRYLAKVTQQQQPPPPPPQQQQQQPPNSSSSSSLQRANPSSSSSTDHVVVMMRSGSSKGEVRSPTVLVGGLSSSSSSLSLSTSAARRRATPRSNGGHSLSSYQKKQQEEGEGGAAHCAWEVPPSARGKHKASDPDHDGGGSGGALDDNSNSGHVVKMMIVSAGRGPPGGAGVLLDDEGEEEEEEEGGTGIKGGVRGVGAGVGALVSPSGSAAGGVSAAKRTMIAMAFVGTSAILYSLQCLEVKMHGKRYSFSTIAFYRALSGTVVALLYALYSLRRRPLSTLLGKRENRFWLSVRGAVGGLAIISAFAAIEVLDLSTASVLGLTAPLWTAILGVLIEKSQWTRYDTGAAAVCVAGVLLMLRPKPIFPDHGGSHAPPPSGLGIMYGLGSALLMAGVNLCIRRLRDESSSVVTLYGMGGSLLIATPGMAMEWVAGTRKQPSQLQDIGGLLSAGVLSWGSQMCMTTALQMSKTLAVMIVRYTDVVWAFIWDRAILQTEPQMTAIIGAVLIIVACLGSTIAVRWRTATTTTTTTTTTKSSTGRHHQNLGIQTNGSSSSTSSGGR